MNQLLCIMSGYVMMESAEAATGTRWAQRGRAAEAMQVMVNVSAVLDVHHRPGSVVEAVEGLHRRLIVMYGHGHHGGADGDKSAGRVMRMMKVMLEDVLTLSSTSTGCLYSLMQLCLLGLRVLIGDGDDDDDDDVNILQIDNDDDDDDHDDDHDDDDGDAKKKKSMMMKTITVILRQCCAECSAGFLPRAAPLQTVLSQLDELLRHAELTIKTSLSSHHNTSRQPTKKMMTTTTVAMRQTASAAVRLSRKAYFYLLMVMQRDEVASDFD